MKVIQLGSAFRTVGDIANWCLHEGDTARQCLHEGDIARQCLQDGWWI